MSQATTLCLGESPKPKLRRLKKFGASPKASPKAKAKGSPKASPKAKAGKAEEKKAAKAKAKSAMKKAEEKKAAKPESKKAIEIEKNMTEDALQRKLLSARFSVLKHIKLKPCNKLSTKIVLYHYPTCGFGLQNRNALRCTAADGKQPGRSTQMTLRLWCSKAKRGWTESTCWVFGPVVRSRGQGGNCLQEKKQWWWVKGIKRMDERWWPIRSVRMGRKKLFRAVSAFCIFINLSFQWWCAQFLIPDCFFCAALARAAFRGKTCYVQCRKMLRVAARF